MIMSTSYLICLPTYNEASYIATFLKELSIEISRIKQTHEDLDISILHIDDNSPDKTSEIAASLKLENYWQLNRPEKLGLGPAYLAGFSWGVNKGFEYFIEMDADGSHHPDQLLELIKASESSDLVIGTRWMPGGQVINWPTKRRLISKLATRYASMALKLPFKDLTSGYRILHSDLVKDLLGAGINSKGYGFQIEMVLLAKEFGAAITQVPITFTERTVGRSKMTGAIVWESLLGITKWAIEIRFTRLYPTGLRR